MSKSILSELVTAVPNRRSFLKKIGVATAAVGAMSVGASVPAEAQTTTEIDVLNFALNLEYLEAEFYTYGLTGSSITNYGIGIDGVANSGNPSAGGAVTGGKKVTFSNNLVFSEAILTQIGSDERAHVRLLREALGSKAIAQPNINLNALGIGFGSQNEFLTLSRIFEDIGVTAYAGAAGLLTTPAIITTAARILAVEAEHVSTVRTQIARLNIQSPKLDGVDIVPPPTGGQDQYLSVNVGDGLVSTRTPGQVLYLAFGMKANVKKGGFFPTGVNGAITTSSAAATPTAANS